MMSTSRSQRRPASRILRSLLTALSILILLNSTPVQHAQAGEGPTRIYLPLVQFLEPDAPPSMTLLGHIRGGMTYATDAQGSYAAAGAGNTVMLVDMADPEAPVMVGQSPDLPDQVKDLRWAGSFVYVAAESAGLQILDVSDPHNPRHVASLHTSRPAWAVDVDGDKAYLALEDGLQIVDVADPLHPVKQGHVFLGHFDRLDVKVAGGLAYVAAQWGGLKVVDVADPLAPTMVGEYVTNPRQAWFVDVAGTNAYLSTIDGGLYVLDVATPSAPTLVGTFKSSSADRTNYYGIAAAGRYAYLGIRTSTAFTATNSLAVIDLINPSQPVSVTLQSLPECAWRINLVDHLAYVSDTPRGMRVLDLSTPTAPREVSAVESVEFAEEIAVEGPRMLLIDSKNGNGETYASLRLLDVSDPAMPRTEAVMRQEPGKAYPEAHVPSIVEIEGRYGYTVGGGWLEIWDLDGSGGPALLSHLADDRLRPRDHEFFVVNKGYMYVGVTEGSAGDVRVLTVDATHPENPRVTGVTRSFWYPDSLTVGEGYLYVASQDQVHVFDLKDPANPQERKPLTRFDGKLAAGAGRLYGGYARTLSIADVSDPAAPQLLTRFSDERLQPVDSLALLNQTVYWMGAWYPVWTLFAIDVRDPHRPAITARYVLPAPTDQVEAAAGRVYVAGYNGVVVLAAQ